MSLSEGSRASRHLTLFRSLHAEALRATVSEGLVHAPNMAARAGIEPTTLRSKYIDSTKAPPCPTMNVGRCGVMGYVCYYLLIATCNGLYFLVL